MAEGARAGSKAAKANEGKDPKAKEGADPEKEGGRQSADKKGDEKAKGEKNVGEKKGDEEAGKEDPDSKKGDKKKGKDKKKEKIPKQKRRPKDTSFCQQRIPAWQPILNAGTMLPLFFVIGIAFIPIGIGLLYFSSEVKEKVVEYTNCKGGGGGGKNGTRQKGSEAKNGSGSCADAINEQPNSPCGCSVDFSLDHDFAGKVFIYYALTNFYQNHRWYVKSRDDRQLHGKIGKKPSHDCEPYAYVEGNDSQKIVPCGAIANSLFNDTLTLVSRDSGDVPILKTGIAWPSDKHVKFRNPGGSADGFNSSDSSKPATWKKGLNELDPNDKDNNGFLNEDFIVWMRTAALPSFRKLYGRVDHSAEGYNNGLAEGNYSVKVNYSFPVSAFKGTKSVIISTTSLLGGKNPFLGIAYITVGFICLCLAIVFLVLHVHFGQTPVEEMNINPNAPYS